MKPFQLQTHYELLEVSVAASATEIRAAYERLSRLYDDSQVVLYGLIDARQAAALRDKLKKSLDVLTDDDARDAYDVSIGLPPRDFVKPKPKPQVSPTPSAPGWGSYAVSYVSPAPSMPAVASSSVYVMPPMAERRSEPRLPTVPAVVTARPPVAEAPPRHSGEGRDPAHRPSAPAPAVEAPPRHPPRQLAEDPAHRPTTAEAPQQASLFTSMPAPQIFERRREVPETPTPAAEPIAAPEISAPQLRIGTPVRLADFHSGHTPPPQPETAAVPFSAEAPVTSTPEEPPVPQLDDEAVQVSIVPAKPVVRETRLVDPKPKPYEVPAGVEINGSLLKQVRMARALTVAQLAERTRIGLKHLENLEADKYDVLPATVYLRGMLMSLARELGLDGIAVCKSYLSFVDAHRAKH